MNAEIHARIKSIFFDAMEVPVEQRLAFVEKACSGDEWIAQEVKSLLLNHRDGTILPRIAPTSNNSDDASTHDQSIEGKATLEKSDAGLTNTKLVLSGLWNENRKLLQRRLRIFATILGVIIGYSIVARALQATPFSFLAVRVICLTIDVVCLSFLARLRRTTLRQMRLLEVIITANVGCLIVVSDFQEMQLLSIDGNAVMIKCAALWNYVVWSLFILTYGTFIPNTWQRAAMVLLPMAIIPYAVDFATQQMYPLVARTLQQDKFGLPLPLPLIAAGIAISAANVIHGARLAAFHARRLAQYELLHEIGAGGMGVVYEARHVMLKRPCAIKVIQPEQSHDPNLLIDFEREVLSTSKLTHPHTIEIYDFGQTNEGLFFYAMELLPGVNLRDLVKQSGPLSPPRTIHFLLQICGALQEAHQRGLIHRDIKPANIFASQRGGIFDFAKLLDFGLVHQMDSDLIPNQRPGRFTAGTPNYMSPEQISDYANIDLRSDLYSLGAVAYFLLVGHPPFPRTSELEVLLAHMNEAVIPPCLLRPEIGSELSQVVLKCLEKSPENRFGSAVELHTALSACSISQDWSQELAAQWWSQKKW